MQDYLLIGGELDGERMALPDGVVKVGTHER